MAILPMNKMTLIGLESDKEKVLKTLQAMSAFELIEVDEQIKEKCNTEMDTSISEIELELADIKSCLEFLKKHDKSKKSLLAQKPEYTETELTNLNALKNEAMPIVSKAQELDGKLSDQKSRSTYLNSMRMQLEPWRTLDVPFEKIQHTEKCKVLLGYITNEQADEENEEIFKELNALDGAYIEKIYTDKERVAVFVVCMNEFYDQLLTALKAHGWQEAPFAGLKGTAQYQLDTIDSELATIESMKLEVEEQASSIARYAERVEAYYDALNNELTKRSTALRTFKTEKAFIMQGWIVEDDKDFIKDELLKQVPDLYIEFTLPAEDEIVPTVLKNPRIVQPFEAVTDLYSKPSAKGFDPNILMAPFYFVFFGMMVSDAGYGIVISIAATAMLLLIKPQGMMKQLVSLIAICGVSTFIWGALYGGWFGLSLQPIWFNPLEEPIYMLAVCFLFGAVHIFVGMGINAYMSIKRGHLMDAILDQFVWMVLLVSLPLLAIEQTAVVAKWTAIASAACLVLTQGRHQKSIIKKFFSGLLSLYNITGYLSDVLSYSRLFALGLATGVIAMVINTIASMLAGSVIGTIFMIPILIGGHIFNIAINVLGAYVHASRLQYIEFFGKFYEAGGREFRPFSYKTKYVRLKKQTNEV